MIRFDSHVHSAFSFDGSPDASPKAIAQAAIGRGITHLAITDHFEANDPDGAEMPYDAENAYAAVFAAKSAFAGRLNLCYGIEIGQINQNPAAALRFLDAYPCECVIGSVHSLRGMPDFYFWDMTAISEAGFAGYWKAYLHEILEILDFDRIDILAHLTYPLRYLKKAGKSFDPLSERGLLEKILGKVIDRKILLEVNSSGFRQGLDAPLPGASVLSLYRSMGGSLVSVGSDAHDPDSIGADFGKTEALLIRLGFDRVYFSQNHRLTEEILGHN